MHRNSPAVAIVLALFLVACSKKPEARLSEQENIPPTVTDATTAPAPENRMISAAIQGRLRKFDGQPEDQQFNLLNCGEGYLYKLISPDGQTGLYTFNGALNEAATVVNVEEYNFVRRPELSLPLTIQEGRTTWFEHRFGQQRDNDDAGMKLEISNDASEGSPLPGQLDLRYPANSFTFKSAPIQPGFSLDYRQYDNTTPNLADLQPGDLRGLDAQGKPVVISPYFIESVLPLQSPQYYAGLQFVAGHTVTASVAIPDNILSKAPQQSTVFEYNSPTGRWIETGTAVRQGNRYVASINKPGYFCVAEKAPAIYIHYKVSLQGTPLTFSRAQLTINPGDAQHSWPVDFYTNSTGEFSAYVPANTQWHLDIRGICGDVLYAADFPGITGPFWKGIDINTPKAAATVTGKVLGCRDQPIKAGYLTITYGQGLKQSYPIKDGNYSFSIPACVGAITYQARDSSNYEYSETRQGFIRSGNNNLSTLVTPCNQDRMESNGSIIYTLRGVMHTISPSTGKVYIDLYHHYLGGSSPLVVAEGIDNSHEFGLSVSHLETGTFEITTLQANVAGESNLMAWGPYPSGNVVVEQLDESKGIFKGHFSSEISRNLDVGHLLDTSMIVGSFNLQAW